MATLDGWSVVEVQSSHQQTGSDLQSMATLSMTSASLNSSEQVAELDKFTFFVTVRLGAPTNALR